MPLTRRSSLLTTRLFASQSLTCGGQRLSTRATICIRMEQKNAHWTVAALIASPKRSHPAVSHQHLRYPDIADSVELQSTPSTMCVGACSGVLRMLLLPPTLLLLPALLLKGRAADAWFARFERALLRALEHGGPCLSKLGQWAATRPDLLPESLCVTLGSLQHSAPLHTDGHTRAAVVQAFGVPVEALFRTLGGTLGSGCIAQVHEAVTLDGVRVAIKVIHPGVEQHVADDLYLMRLALAVAQGSLSPFVSGLRWLALSESLDEFAAFMARQLDLRHEAASLETFSANFRDDPRVRFPAPVRGVGEGGCHSLVSRHVLVESYLGGETLAAMLQEDAREGPLAAKRHAARNQELARLGLHTFLTMLLRHNFVHADLHPGNILVSQDDRGHWVLGLVDAGLVVQLEERDRLNFLQLFRAIGQGDGAHAGELMLTRAREQRCSDPDAFREGMRELVTQARAGERGAFNLAHLRIGDVLLEVTRLVRIHQVQADPIFTTLVCSIAVLEGVGRTLDPTLDLFDVALPMLAGLAMSLPARAL